MKSLCIAFIAIKSQMGLHLPPNVLELAKNQIVHQIQAQYPNIEAQFEGDCSRRISYLVDAENFIFNATNDIWKGRLHISINNLLEGRKIPYAKVIHMQSTGVGSQLTQKPLPPMPQEKKMDKKKKEQGWLPWLVMGVIGATAAGLAWYHIDRGARNKSPGRSDTPASNPPNTGAPPVNPAGRPGPSPGGPRPI